MIDQVYHGDCLHILPTLPEKSVHLVYLDPFCGSGTTLIAAQRHNRHYIGIDISLEAVQLAQKRLQNPHRSTSLLMQRGRQAYQNLPDDVLAILKTLPVKPVQRNRGIDAIHDKFYHGKPIFIRVQRQGEDLTHAARKLAHAGNIKNAGLLILIQTESSDQMGLFSSELPPQIIIVDALARHIEQIIHEKITIPEG